VRIAFTFILRRFEVFHILEKKTDTFYTLAESIIRVRGVSDHIQVVFNYLS